jgi:hypothetical protein
MKRELIHVAIASAILIPIALVYAGVNIYNGIDDAYAQWGAADMVVAYMRDHDGKWPPDWASLKPYFDQNNGRVGDWSYERFQSHVFIDFAADAMHLRRLSWESDTVVFDVIHATSLWADQFNGGPNEILHRYFRESEDVPDAGAAR